MPKLIGYAAGLLLCATLLRAAFVDDLAPPERAGAGLDRLSPSQLGALNDLVDHDQTLARQGGVTGFDRGFVERRTPKERIQAGLDRLDDVQREKLDSLVAFVIANPQTEVPHYVRHPIRTPVAPSPAATPVVFTPKPPKPEVHGDLSLTVGGGKGVSFYGSSLDLYMVDPAGKWSIGVSISQFHGKGPVSPYLLDPSWPWYGPGSYPYPYPLMNWPPLPPLLDDGR